MNRNLKRGLLILGLAVALLGGGAASCATPQSENSDKIMDLINDKIAGIKLCGEPNDSLECKNLAEKLKRDEDPNRITYLYLTNMMGDPYAYWVVKGKVSSNQSQRAPEFQVVDVCPGTDHCWQVVDAPGDDGSSGPNEDGVFFFTPDGNKIVVGGGNYLQSDFPFELPGVKELKVRK